MRKQLLFSVLISVLICNAALLVAQRQSTAASTVAPVSTVSGIVSQFNYGPDGRVEGFLIAPNTLVSLPPDWAIQVEMLAKTGSQVRVTGATTPSPSGMQILHPQSLDVAGKTFTLAVPSQAALCAASGVIRTLNYGPKGEINGFVLQNGVIARTPPIGANDVSVVKPGASISVSGFARATPSGRTVVEVQSITANGQSIAMNFAPLAGPGLRGPERGPRAGAGPRDSLPPPHPAVPTAPAPSGAIKPPPPAPNR